MIGTWWNKKLHADGLSCLQLRACCILSCIKDIQWLVLNVVDIQFDFIVLSSSAVKWFDIEQLLDW